MNLKEFLEQIRALSELKGEGKNEWIKYLFIENPTIDDNEWEKMNEWHELVEDVWENHKEIPDDWKNYKVESWDFDYQALDPNEQLYIMVK